MDARESLYYYVRWMHCKQVKEMELLWCLSVPPEMNSMPYYPSVTKKNSTIDPLEEEEGLLYNLPSRSCTISSSFALMFFQNATPELHVACGATGRERS